MLELFERLLAALIILALLTLVLFIALPPDHPVTPCPPNTACPDQPQVSIPPDTPKPGVFQRIGNLFHPYSAEQLNIDPIIDKIIYAWAGVMILYLLGSFVNLGVISVPSWTELRGISEHQLFKLSYVALFLIPLLIYFMHVDILKWEFAFHVPTNAKLSYFSAFSFAIGGIIYGITSPKKNVATDAEIDKSRLFWRWLCYLSLMYGVLFLLIAFYRTSLFVFFAK